MALSGAIHDAHVAHMGWVAHPRLITRDWATRCAAVGCRWSWEEAKRTPRPNPIPIPIPTGSASLAPSPGRRLPNSLSPLPVSSPASRRRPCPPAPDHQGQGRAVGLGRAAQASTAALASMFVGSGEAVAVLGGTLAAADLIFRTTTSRHHHHREEGQVAAALRLSLMCSGTSSTSSPLCSRDLAGCSRRNCFLPMSWHSRSLRFSVCASPQRVRREKGGGLWEMGGAQISMNLG
jgi:hypothetical protein